MSTSGAKPSTSGVIRSGRRSAKGHEQSAASPLNKTTPTRAKSGCWTCRLRRKKCDENRRSDGSCETCKRLRLECLGWGAKRPEWCRDKEKVEKYKLQLKQQVSFHGNGHPSSIGLAANSSTNGRLGSSAGSGDASDPLHAKSSFSSSDHFALHPVIMPDGDGFGGNAHDDGYPTLTNLTNVNPLPDPNGHSVHATDVLTDWELLGDLVAFNLPSYQQPQNQTPIWPDLNTPDLNMRSHDSPNANPITTAIDQSMVGIGMPLAQPGPSSWDSFNYTSPGPLPSLYGIGSGASFVEPEGANADGIVLGPPSLPALQGSLASNGTANFLAGQPHKQPNIDAQIVRKRIFYYFNRVRKTQYWFAGETTKDILRDIVVANPFGVVTNAICALASIHHTLMLRSAGKEAEDPEAPTSLPRRFFNQASEQIMASKTQNGSYTALDATAALQLVSFSLFVGGIRGWESALRIAGDWYEKTGVVGHENPLRAMWELNPTAKFASRLVVWFDIFSSITFQRPARFLSTYRQMLRQNDIPGASKKFWRKDLNMQATMGCSDAILLAIAETAELAHWKDQQKMQGCLSNRELNRRAELIEQDLKIYQEELELEEARAVLASSAMAAPANSVFFGNAYANTTTGMSLINTVSSAPGTPSSTSGESMPSILNATPSGCGPITLPSDGTTDAAAAAATAAPSAPIPTSVNVTPLSSAFPVALPSPPAPFVSDESRRSSLSSSESMVRSNSPTEPSLPAGLSEGDIRRRATRIFLEGTFLYLQTVVNDSNPNVTEVVEGVRAVMESAYLLPPSDIDRSLVFPFFIAGCMAEAPEQREFFKARLGAHKTIGNCPSAIKLMEAVWQKRETISRIAAANGVPSPKSRVHWRDVMEEMGMKLLLV